MVSTVVIPMQSLPAGGTAAEWLRVLPRLSVRCRLEAPIARALKIYWRWSHWPGTVRTRSGWAPRSVRSSRPPDPEHRDERLEQTQSLGVAVAAPGGQGPPVRQSAAAADAHQNCVPFLAADQTCKAGGPQTPSSGRQLWTAVERREALKEDDLCCCSAAAAGLLGCSTPGVNTAGSTPDLGAAHMGLPAGVAERLGYCHRNLAGKCQK